MLNGGTKLGRLRDAGAWVTSRPARWASGLALAVASFEALDPARGKERRGDKNRRDENENQDSNRESVVAGADEESVQTEASDQNRKSDDGRNSEKDQDRRSSDKEDGNSRSESRNKDDNSNREESGGGKDRQDSKRHQTNAESNDNDRDDESGGQNGGRHGQSDEFAQKADKNQRDDEPAETPTPTPTPTTNPNVAIDDVPAGDDLELVVQSNPDVIANVSSRGGFAFAQSNGVTAISGPDGAKIIQTGETATGTIPGTATPTEPPADGGNNDTDFAS